MQRDQYRVDSNSKANAEHFADVNSSDIGMDNIQRRLHRCQY
jgi:hypothetical protein